MNDILNNVVKPLNCSADNMALEWEAWKNQLEIFLKVKGIKEEDKKKDVLLLLGGLDLQRICTTLPEVDEDQFEGLNGAYEKLIAKLDRFFVQKRSKRFERHVFRKIKQLEQEKFERFVMRLRLQATKCDWSLLQMNDNIVDQIVEGCLEDKVRSKIMEKDLDIEDVIKMGNSVETLQEQKKQFKNTERQPTFENVNKIETKNKFSHMKCNRCGYSGHSGSYPKCPAVGKTCNICNAVGHFASQCKTKRRVSGTLEKPAGKRPRFEPVKKEVNQIENQDSGDEYLFHIDGMDKVPVKVGGVEVELIVDSGATVNVLSVTDWEYLKTRHVKVSAQDPASAKKLLSYGSKVPLKVIGSFWAEVVAGRSTIQDRFFVVENGKNSLMGNVLAKKLGILKINVDISMVEEKNEVFPALKGFDVSVKIDPEVTPVFQPYRRIPLELEKKVSGRIQELIQKDIVEKVEGYSKWASPLVVVPKGQEDIRLCVDLRRANKAVLVESFPFPNIEEMMAKLNGSKCFSKIDIKDAYYQVQLTENSREITTFVTKGN